MVIFCENNTIVKVCGAAHETACAVPSGVTAIGEGAFRNCPELVHPELPEGLTAIGRGAFAGCDALELGAVPASLHICGRDAFTPAAFARMDAAAAVGVMMAGYVLPDYAAFCLRKKTTAIGPVEAAAMLLTQADGKILADCEAALGIGARSIPAEAAELLVGLLGRYPPMPRRYTAAAEYLVAHHAQEAVLDRLLEQAVADKARSAEAYLRDVQAKRVERL